LKSKLDWIWENYPVDGYDGGLTEEQAKDLCVEMWNEMAENTYLEKENSKLIKIFDPECSCFACEYYASKNERDADNDEDFIFVGDWKCLGCVFLKFKGCLSQKSPYKKWVDESNRNLVKSKNLRKYAIEIADLFID